LKARIKRIEPARREVITDGQTIPYHFLLIATGPEIDTDALSGAGGDGSNAYFIHTEGMALATAEALEAYLVEPPPELLVEPPPEALVEPPPELLVEPPPELLLPLFPELPLEPVVESPLARCSLRRRSRRRRRQEGHVAMEGDSR